MKRIRDFRSLVSALPVASSAAVAYAKTTTVLQLPGQRVFEDFGARSEVRRDGHYVPRTFIDGKRAPLKLSGSANTYGLLHRPHRISSPRRGAAADCDRGFFPKRERRSFGIMT
jgi:hypothetical protein